MKRLILAVLVFVLLGSCAGPPAPTMVKRIDAYQENMDGDADNELVVQFTLVNDSGEVVVANGVVNYTFLYSPQFSKEEVVILTVERRISDKNSDLPVYFDREHFQVSCPTCKGLGYVTCSVCGGTGIVECWRCDGTGQTTPGFGTLCLRCGGTGQVRCSNCEGTGQHKCPDWHCKGGILDLSGAMVSLVVEFEGEYGVTLEGECDSVLLP